MKKNKKLQINFDKLKSLSVDRRQTVVGGTSGYAESCGGEEETRTGTIGVVSRCGIASA